MRSHSIQPRTTLRNAGRRPIPAAPKVALLLGLILTCVYAWLLDDAFIYFRYADNASLLGAGLVFNKGQFVEGYTSPLWMVLLVALRTVGGRYWPAILAIALSGMFATWLLAVRVNRRLSNDGPLEVHLPALWIASCYAVQSHFTSGLETPLVQVFALAFAALVMEPENRSLQGLVALGPLVRPELALATALAVAWCWYTSRRLPRLLLLVTVLTQAAWLCFRIYHYADVVPNTFHLKDTTEIARGVHYVHDTLRAYHLYVIMGGLLALLAAAALRHGHESVHLAPRAVLWVAAIAHTAYVIRIGGDFVHYRYLAFPVLVIMASLGGVVEHHLGTESRARRWIVSGAGIGFVGLIAASYPRAQLPAHPLLLRPEGDSLQMYRANGIEDAAAHRLRNDLAAWGWDTGTDGVRVLLQDGALTYTWAIETGWCRYAYAHLDWYVVQSFGLTEPALAHVAVPSPSLQAGHRWEFAALARDLVRLRIATGILSDTLSDEDEGVYARAVREHFAPSWMVKNVSALDEIERRTEHAGSSWQRVVAAFRAWPTIEVPDEDLAAAARSQP
jgi:hypothetical protein